MPYHSFNLSNQIKSKATLWLEWLLRKATRKWTLGDGDVSFGLISLWFMHPCKVTSKLFGLCTPEKLPLSYSFSPQIPVHWIKDFDRTVLELLLLCTKAEIINTYLDVMETRENSFCQFLYLFMSKLVSLSLSLSLYISMLIRPNTAKRALQSNRLLLLCLFPKLSFPLWDNALFSCWNK